MCNLLVLKRNLGDWFAGLTLGNEVRHHLEFGLSANIVSWNFHPVILYFGESKLDCGSSHVNSPDCSQSVPQCLDDLLPYGEFSVLHALSA